WEWSQLRAIFFQINPHTDILRQLFAQLINFTFLWFRSLRIDAVDVNFLSTQNKRMMYSKRITWYSKGMHLWFRPEHFFRLTHIQQFAPPEVFYLVLTERYGAKFHHLSKNNFSLLEFDNVIFGESMVANNHR